MARKKSTGRVCPSCKIWKPRTGFYETLRKKEGHKPFLVMSSSCRECSKKKWQEALRKKRQSVEGWMSRKEQFARPLALTKLCPHCNRVLPSALWRLHWNVAKTKQYYSRWCKTCDSKEGFIKLCPGYVRSVIKLQLKQKMGEVNLRGFSIPSDAIDLKRSIIQTKRKVYHEQGQKQEQGND